MKKKCFGCEFASKPFGQKKKPNPDCVYCQLVKKAVTGADDPKACSIKLSQKLSLIAEAQAARMAVASGIQA